MALDTSASDVALGQLAALPFKNIIGGPLTASIEAQALAAKTTVDFIRAVGLQEVNGKVEATNVQFTYQDGTGTYRRVTVPLLTILPIPFIVIDTVDIQFKARIAASAQQASEERDQSEVNAALSMSAWGGGRRWGGSATFSASYSAKKDSKASQESKYSVEYTMDVHVHASQAGIPQGMAQILNILQDGITNTPEAAQLLIFGLPGSLTWSTANPIDEAFTVLALEADGDPGAYNITVAFAPTGILKLDQANSVLTNPGKVMIDQDGTAAPATDTDVTLTITATPTNTSSTLPTLVATRTVTVVPG